MFRVLHLSHPVNSTASAITKCGQKSGLKRHTSGRATASWEQGYNMSGIKYLNLTIKKVASVALGFRVFPTHCLSVCDPLPMPMLDPYRDQRGSIHEAPEGYRILHKPACCECAMICSHNSFTALCPCHAIVGM